jgi:membrane protein
MIFRALQEAFNEIRQDRLAMVAASVGFYVLLSLVPAISTTLTVYRSLYDPQTIVSQLGGMLSFAPPAVGDLVLEQARRLATQTSNQKWLSFAVSFLVSVWSANAGVKAIFSALNEVNGLTEQRGFIRYTLVTLATTASALLLFVLSLTAIALMPAMLAFVPFEDEAHTLMFYAHWPAFLAVATACIAVLYWIGPCWQAPLARPPAWRHLLPGAFGAALIWVMISAAFSWYTPTLGHYSAMYGSLAAVVVFMTWLWLSTLAVLGGAAFNAALARARALAAAPRKPYGAG